MNWHLLSFNTFILSCANKIEKWRRGRKLRGETILSLLLLRKSREKRPKTFFFCQSFSHSARKTKRMLSYYFTFFWLNEKYYEQENCSVSSSFTLKPFYFFCSSSTLFISVCILSALFFLSSPFLLLIQSGFFSRKFVVSFNYYYYYYSCCMLMLRSALDICRPERFNLIRSLCNSVRMVSVTHFQSPYSSVQHRNVRNTLTHTIFLHKHISWYDTNKPFIFPFQLRFSILIIFCFVLWSTKYKIGI